MEGWRISCWPFDSQFSWHPDSKRLALTWTSDTLANNWETVRVLEVDVSATTLTTRRVGGHIAFQPIYSSTGLLAFTQSSSADYAWAQTWKICIESAGTVNCDERGTFDEMPTLVGWTAEGVLYMEQHGTEVGLFLMSVSAGKPMQWQRVSGTPCAKHPSSSQEDCGVIGGGFRSTSRVTISGDKIAFSWENLHTAPQAFVATLNKDSASQVRQISALNEASHSAQLPTVYTRRWQSDDGQAVEGLLLCAHTSANCTVASASPPPPLLVFTHCGPAMASLGTFLGAGSVCARFPLAIWAMRGYNVLLPNYRGSTGYGSEFRRGDLNGWGAGDYDDVMSGFVAMARDGLADLSHVGHVGWSYGGYTSALALTKAKASHGITLKAVVGGGCLADLISQTGTTDISKIYQSSNSGKYYWEDPVIQDNFMARSAMYHVANASAPTLLFHGQHDPRMPISQAFQLHYALQARGVESRFLVFPGAGHIPGDPNQILRVWDESLEWVAKHLPVA